MMIRKSNEAEIDQLVELWYQVSLEAHSFVSPDYWLNGKQDMREKYLPMADTYVMIDKGKIVGFVSMVNHYLAAIFIDSSCQGMGYGKRLLDFVKEMMDFIELKVFKKNNQAYRFYSHNGFYIQSELIDEALNEVEYVMTWRK